MIATRILAYVLLALACVGFGYVQGISRESDRRDAQALQQTRAAVAAAGKESTRREAVGAAREVSRERIRVVYRTTKEKADVYIDTHKEQIPPSPPLSKGGAHRAGDFVACGLDADGLRIWNAANAGAAAPVSGEPDYALPIAAAGALGRAARLADQPHRGDGAGGAVPRSAGETGGVRER